MPLRVQRVGHESGSISPRIFDMWQLLRALENFVKKSCVALRVVGTQQCALQAGPFFPLHSVLQASTEGDI